MLKSRDEYLEIIADIYGDMDEQYATLRKIWDETESNEDLITDSEAQEISEAYKYLDRAQTELKKLLRRARKI
jgi:hypothetical protein